MLGLILIFLLLFLFWHASLGVHIPYADISHQRAILSQVNCFVHCEVVDCH